MTTLMSIIIAVLFLAVCFSLSRKINFLLSEMSWIRSRFESTSASTGLTWRINLAHEFFTLKEQIAPFYFLPLANTAKTIIVEREMLNEELEKAKKWEKYEYEELEAFASSNPKDGTAFNPSEKLNEALDVWIITQSKLEVVNGWSNLFQQVFLELITGKISLENAEKKLEVVEYPEFKIPLSITDLKGDARNWANKFKNRCIEKWDAKNWRETLKTICERENNEADFRIEMRKVELLKKTKSGES